VPKDLSINPEALELLSAYPWPGNVREMENVISRAYILADGDCITTADLPPEITRLSPPSTFQGGVEDGIGGLREQMRRIEAGIILRAIEEALGDRRVAARHLGIGLSSLYRKLEELRIPKDLEENAEGPSVTA
jgi:two-component system response regulator AtoC